MAKTKKDRTPAPAEREARPRLSAHPRARRQIRAVKAWSGLCAFLLVQYVALHAGMSWFDAGLRALAAGVGAYVLGWLVAVFVWRQLAVAELESLRRRLSASSGGHGAAT